MLGFPTLIDKENRSIKRTPPIIPQQGGMGRDQRVGKVF
nr:MAG TPA: hypothetical protein [Caudoviricetes sp.]